MIAGHVDYMPKFRGYLLEEILEVLDITDGAYVPSKDEDITVTIREGKVSQ